LPLFFQRKRGYENRSLLVSSLKNSRSQAATTILLLNYKEKGMLHSIFWAIVALLVVLWILGLIFRIGRCFIHVLLVIAVVVLLINVFSLVFRVF
jgi:uncharacterized protein DUF5670